MEFTLGFLYFLLSTSTFRDVFVAAAAAAAAVASATAATGAVFNKLNNFAICCCNQRRTGQTAAPNCHTRGMQMVALPHDRRHMANT